MADSTVIGLRVRPWSLNGKHLCRTTNRHQVDVWAIEKCTLLSYSDGKSYLNWKSIYDFPSKEQALKEMNAMQPQLATFSPPSRSEPPQAGDLILLQTPGDMSGALGLIEGVYGEFANEFDVHLNADTSWICESKTSRQLAGTGGLQYKINRDLLVDTAEVIYHEFKYGYPSQDENKIVQLPVRLYLLKIEAQASAENRKTA